MKTSSGYAYDAITDVRLGKPCARQPSYRERERRANNAILAEIADQRRLRLFNGVARALKADWLSDGEICEEFGCAQDFIASVRTALGMKRSKRWTGTE